VCPETRQVHGADRAKEQGADDLTDAKRISLDERTLHALQNQCGPFAVLTVAQFWGLRPTLAEIRSLTAYDCRLGTTTGAIRQALEALGLQALSAEVTFPVLQDMLNQNIPAVVGCGDGHVAVALPPCKDERVLLVDATTLKCEYVESEAFRRYWNGMAIFARAHDSPNLLETAKMVQWTQIRHRMVAALPPLVGALAVLCLKGWRLYNHAKRGE
jgi:ABC-type bacteriocin/lantibiotic exporter with double-glycine peptidase domain